jgi:hypothetical protein
MACRFLRLTKAKPDFHSATQPEWNLACEREAVIRPLAQADSLSPVQVDAGAVLPGLSRSSVYRLVARFKRRPTTSSLLPPRPVVLACFACLTCGSKRSLRRPSNLFT